MLKVRLICAAGMSTSMVVQKMHVAAKKQNLEIDIKAMSETAFEELNEDVDILLLGPQIGHIEGELKEKYKDKDWSMAVINMVDYGMLNGEKILKDSLALVERE